MSENLVRLREIRRRMLEIEKERDNLQKEMDQLLELASGTRKTGRKMLTKEAAKALFADLGKEARSHERR